MSARGWARRPGERVVSLFAYANDKLPALLDELAREPTLLLACPGPLQALATPWGALRTLALPLLAQPDYDRLLWACDLNFVRGEDSFVRAQWAGKPFVWHIYPQHDGAHGPKLEAFMERAGLPGDARALWRAWNGLSAWPERVLPRWDARAWRDQLAAQPDLTSQLLGENS